MRDLLFLFCLAAVLIVFAFLSSARHSVEAAAGPAPDVRRMLLRDIRPGMKADSVELLAGTPALIVDGVPELQKEEFDGLPARAVEENKLDRYESWYYRSSRIDTVRSPSTVVLFDPENNEYPQQHRTAYLKYSLTVVINKTTERVTRVEYLPRGFVDRDGDIQEGAVIG